MIIKNIHWTPIVCHVRSRRVRIYSWICNKPTEVLWDSNCDSPLANDKTEAQRSSVTYLTDVTELGSWDSDWNLQPRKPLLLPSTKHPVKVLTCGPTWTYYDFGVHGQIGGFREYRLSHAHQLLWPRESLPSPHNNLGSSSGGWRIVKWLQAWPDLPSTEQREAFCQAGKSVF